MTGNGFPALSEIPASAQVVARTAAAADLALRTAVASLLTVSMAPLAVFPTTLNSDREGLDFYRELASHRDTERAFPRPAHRVHVHTKRVRRIVPLPGGQAELLRAESPFVALNPAVRDRYHAHKRNRTAWAQHWRHDDGPRPTLCVIHGFMGSGYSLNSAFFSLPWFYGHGYDVLLLTMPFHGRRRDARSPYSGHGFFAHGIAHINEAMAQAVHDARMFFDYLEANGVDQLGVTGLSLGGYMTALLAAVDDRLDFAIPNAAVTNLPDLTHDWFPIGQVMDWALPRRGIDVEEVHEALAVHSPLNYPVRLPHDRLFIIAGLGDRLAPPDHSQQLWEHWGRPKYHWFPGNHILHVNRGAYLRRMGKFMGEIGFEAAA